MFICRPRSRSQCLDFVYRNLEFGAVRHSSRERAALHGARSMFGGWRHYLWVAHSSLLAAEIFLAIRFCVAAGCVLGTFFAFFARHYLPFLAGWWLAAAWWFAFSGGLWYFDTRAQDRRRVY